MTKNGCLAGLEPGSAAYVVAHARWKRSRGRRPSMKYLTEQNPGKSLTSAQIFLAEISRRQKLEGMLSRVPRTTPRQAVTLDESQIKLHTRRIAVECTSKEEFAQRLADELGIKGAAINWLVPTDKTGIEARDLVRALGGLVSKSGAMVMMMAYAPSGMFIQM